MFKKIALTAATLLVAATMGFATGSSEAEASGYRDNNGHGFGHRHVVHKVVRHNGYGHGTKFYKPVVYHKPAYHKPYAFGHKGYGHGCTLVSYDGKRCLKWY